MNIFLVWCAFIFQKKRKKDNKTDVANETTGMFLKNQSGQNCVKQIIQEKKKKSLFRVISLEKKCNLFKKQINTLDGQYKKKRTTDKSGIQIF